MLFDLEQEKYFGSERHAGLWEMFLREEEKNICKLGFYPAYFEVAFGRAGRKTEQDPLLPKIDALTLKHAGQSLKITGKVDRVDLNERGAVLLLDYKTGSAGSTAKNVLNGVDLQLPVYAIAINDLLKAAQPDADISPVMTAIYKVRDPENCQREPVMFDKSALPGSGIRGNAALPNKNITDETGRQLTFDELLDRTEAFLFDYVAKIRNGEFRHTRFPEENPCKKYCDFRRMCRKDVGKLSETSKGSG